MKFSFCALASLLAIAPVAVRSHATQFNYCIAGNGSVIRIFVQQWHGDLVTSSLAGMALTITGAGNSYTAQPAGFLNNVDEVNLATAGGCDGTSTTVLSTCSGTYNDWVVFDLCDGFIGGTTYTLVSAGSNVILELVTCNPPLLPVALNTPAEFAGVCPSQSDMPSTKPSSFPSGIPSSYPSALYSKTTKSTKAPKSSAPTTSSSPSSFPSSSTNPTSIATTKSGKTVILV